MLNSIDREYYDYSLNKQKTFEQVSQIRQKQEMTFANILENISNGIGVDNRRHRQNLSQTFSPVLITKQLPR